MWYHVVWYCGIVTFSTPYSTTHKPKKNPINCDCKRML